MVDYGSLWAGEKLSHCCPRGSQLPRAPLQIKARRRVVAVTAGQGRAQRVAVITAGHCGSRRSR